MCPIIGDKRNPNKSFATRASGQIDHRGVHWKRTRLLCAHVARYIQHLLQGNRVVYVGVWGQSGVELVVVDTFDCEAGTYRFGFPCHTSKVVFSRLHPRRDIPTPCLGLAGSRSICWRLVGGGLANIYWGIRDRACAAVVIQHALWQAPHTLSAFSMGNWFSIRGSFREGPQALPQTSRETLTFPGYPHQRRTYSTAFS
jgi:hypothetical protein